MQLNVKSDRIWSFYLLNVQRLSPLLQTPGPVCVWVWLKIIKLEWFWESKQKVSQKCNLFRMAKHFHRIRLTGLDTSSVRPFDFHRNNSFNCSFHKKTHKNHCVWIQPEQPKFFHWMVKTVRKMSICTACAFERLKISKLWVDFRLPKSRMYIDNFFHFNAWRMTFSHRNSKKSS